MQNYLIVNAFADNTNENIQKFSRLAKSSICEVIDCQLKVMGHFFSSIFLFSGSWDAIAKIEDNLDKLQKEENISIQKTRTEIDELKSDCIAYGVDIIGPDQTNIVFDIVDFMVDSNLIIKNVVSNTYKTSNTGTKMFELHISAYIPLSSSIATIRSEFIEFCDQFNLDIIMEPLK